VTFRGISALGDGEEMRLVRFEGDVEAGVVQFLAVALIALAIEEIVEDVLAAGFIEPRPERPAGGRHSNAAIESLDMSPQPAE